MLPGIAFGQVAGIGPRMGATSADMRTLLGIVGRKGKDKNPV
jgi:hypothetical protein